MSKTVTKISEQTMAVKFYSQDKTEFYSVLDAVKALPGRKWNAKQKSWECPITEHNLKQLASLQFDISDDLISFIKPRPEIKLKSDILFPYQIPHTETLISALIGNGSALDASDTGTGKTFVSLQVAKYLNLKPISLVPKSSIPKWNKVAKNIFNLDLFASNYEQFKIGNTPYCEPFTTIVTKKKNGKKIEVEETDFTWSIPDNSILIFDEAHRCANRKTQNARLLIRASETKTPILMLSATLADNPLQMFAAGRVLKIFTSDQSFWHWSYQRGVDKAFFGVEFKDTKDKKYLKKIHRDIFPDKGSRLTVADAGDLFPDNFIMSDAIGMNESKEIQKVYDEMRKEIKRHKKKVSQDKEHSAMHLTENLRARQEIELLKVPTFVEMALDHVEEGMSVAIFVNFEETIQSLKTRLKTDCIITGKISADEKEKNRVAFQEGKERIILLNSQAGGESIDLHDEYGNYPRISLISPTPRARDLKQILGRLPRAGAKSKVIQKIIFAADTVEEQIADRVAEKIKNINVINDGDLQI